MSETLKIYSSLQGRFTQCYYYRLLVPIRAMHALRLPAQYFVVRSEDQTTAEEESGRFFGADVAFLYQPIGGAAVERLSLLANFRPRRGTGGEWRWPPTVVVDTDDDLFNIHPLNPAFAHIGVKVDGQDVLPGQQIHWVDGRGMDKIIWQEGHGGFVLGDNLHRLARWRDTISMADAVTCTTPFCEEYLRKNSAPKRTFVSPNSVMLEDYPNYGGIEMVRKNPSEVRILWQGSDSHHEDLAGLRNAINYLTHRYPNIKWVFWGALFEWLMEDLPTDRYEFHKWVDPRAYFTKLGTIVHDINICPLQKTPFARARSAIKWYESSCIKTPAATVASNWGGFELEIEDGKTGLLFNNPAEFIEQISTLVENQKLRTELASNAKDWVLENRDAMKTVPKLYEYLLNLREQKKTDMPPTPEDEVPLPELEAMDGDLPAEHADSR